MRKSHILSLAFALAVFAFAFAPAAQAQYPGYLTNSNDTGLPSYGSFISSNIDVVNLGTGGVTIRIPIYSVTGRGKTATTVLQYDSKYWTSIPTVSPNTGNGQVVYYNWHPDANSAMWQSRASGGNSIGSLDWTETTFSCDMPPQGGDAGAEIVYQFGPATVIIRSNYIYTSPDGSRHQLPLRNNFPQLYPGYCPNLNNGQLPTNLIAETDNGQVRVDLTNDQYNPSVGHAPVITLADGTHSASLGETDTNGNICCAAGRPAATFDSSSTMNHQVWDVVDSSGGTHQVIVDFVNISIATAFPTTSYDTWHQVSQYSGQLRVVSKITLANGLAYNFTYDSTYGEVTKITLPTGGYVKYTWSTIAKADLGPSDPLSSIMATPQIDARRISQRIVSEDGTSGSEKIWSYSYPTIGGNLTGVTSVTDPLGNREDHSFGSCTVGNFNSFTGQPSTDDGVSYYDPSGRLLKTVSTNWSCDKGALYIAYPGLNLPATYSLLTEGIRNLRQTGSVTTLADTNQVSETQSDFTDCTNYTIYGQTYTNCRDNPTETREYDYGTGSHGALVRKTDFTYLHNSSSSYLNAHIVDRVTLKSVYDGSSNLVAKTQYGYDGTTITSATGATNHDDTNYPATNTLRGNVTTVGRWLSSSSTWLTTTNYYNSVGNLVQTTDPGGHSYNLSYTDNYTDGTNHNSQAFLTSVTSPTTANGVPHVEGKQYYWYTGLTAAVCGQNAPTPNLCSHSQGLPAADYASYTYDLMNRPHTVTHGDGGITTFTFQETTLPFNVSSSSQIDGSQNLVNTAVIDGIGRVKQTQLNSDPDGVDLVDTTYDPAGQKATVSNPYRYGITSPTDGVTTYLYDALGRTTTVIPPDGTSTSNNVTTAYSGNSVTVTDQAGKQRRSFTDALGRLIEVDEPSAPAGATSSNGYALLSGTLQIGGGASGHGTVTISGTEQSGQGDPPCTLYDCGGSCIQWGQPPVYYDQGHVSITVNGHTDTVGYSQGSTSAGIAAGLVTTINADSSASVSASVPVGGTVITLSTKVHSASTYTLSATAWSTDTSGYIWMNSFTASPSGSTLIAGVNDTTDTGTVWVNVAGVQVSASYGSGSTAATVATALAAAINGSSTIPVTASASSGIVNLTDKTQGSALSITTGATTNNSSIFSHPSFGGVVSDEYLNPYATTPPGSLLTPMVTLYTYDTLDNLTCVEQHGTATGQTGCSSAASNDASSAWRIRRFTYDSLSRLVTAKNPESGTISYTYDSDGNVFTKTDARGITTTMTYDQLHRVLTKTYSDGTPTATYIYDVASTDGPGSSAYPIGRLVEVKNSNAKEVDSYDSRGRISAQWQCTPLNCGSSWFNLTYAYNYAGGLISESTPMGFTLSPTYDAAARLKQLTSSWSDAQHPANLLTVDASAGYTPAGALAKMTYGNGLVETSAYNSRLQPTQLRTYNPTTNTDVLNLTYGFTNSAGANNGNVVTFNSTATQIFMRTYTYDELNRLSTMSSPADASGCYGLAWTYDAWGNRLNQSTTSGACGSPNHGMNAANRIIDTGYAHDSAGNMTSDAIHAYAFDAENRIVTMDTTGTTYVYDAGGQRVRKTTGGVTTDYAYDLGGVVAEIQSSTWMKGYVNFGNRFVAQYNGVPGASGATTIFSHTDHLGSARVMTAVLAGVSDSMDYLPFGELLSGGGSTTHKFTGKERDGESNLDYFGARYYSSSVGRFTAADSPFADQHPEDPQSWNLYAYTRNNPLNFVDTNGREIKFATDLKNPNDVKAVVSALLADPNTRSQLSGYVGPDNPDLVIKSGDLNPNGPLVTRNDDGSTTTTRVEGNTDADIQTTQVDHDAPETHLVSTTITIDNGVKGIDKVAEVVSHESDHAKQARTDPTGYKNEAAQNKRDYPDRKDHDKRSQEQRANAFAKAHAKAIAKQAKKIKKDEKKDGQP